MTVDRHGEQHYEQQAGITTTIALLEVEKAGFAKASTEWLGERLERRKLERLGSLMPWHEFK